MKGVPLWPTTMRTNLGDGRLIGVNPHSRDGIGSVWLYKRVPLSPMVDAASTKDLQASVAPLMSAFSSLAQSSGSLGGRRLAEATYREFHLLGINVPRRFRPPAGHDLHDLLLESFGDRTVERRLVLLGVRLVPSIDFSAGLGAAIRGFAESLTSTGVPLVEFNKDFRQLDAELSRAGLATPTEGDIRLANCWWSMGRYPDTPLMPHHNHVHVFNTVQQAVRAERNAPEDCADWTPETVPGEYAVTMGAITGFDVNGKSSVSDRRARWFSDLLVMGALCVSMRGKVEPPKVTLGVIRKNKGTYERDIQERDLAGKSGLSDQRGRLAELAMIESVYATEDAPPTLKGLSVIAGFDGNVADLKDITSMDLALELAPMSDLQPAAMAETYLCSPARGNPALHDVPAHVVGYSGVTSLSVVGDPPSKAVLVGMTETDRQPAWLAVSGASDEDREPYMVVPAATGSGKALTLSTRIPTPTGCTTMGKLRVGDRVLGRDGKPCTVTYLSPIIEQPDLYRLRFSDGQTVVADGNHQWVVHQQPASAGGRRTRRAKTLDHLIAGQRRRRLVDGASTLSQMAGANPGPNPRSMAGSIDSDRTCTLTELWHSVKGLGLWNSPVGVLAALRLADCPTGGNDRPPDNPARNRRDVRTQAEAQACARAGQVRHQPARHSARHGRRMVGSSAPTGSNAPTADAPVGECGPEPRFVARIALAALATRLLQRADGVRVLGSGEETLSTLEMIDLACDGRTGLGVRAAEPLELDPVSCRHDPYRLAHLLLEAHGTDEDPGCNGTTRGEDLLDSFRACLRGSDFQRLRLLQGLMDTTGCVTRLGGCGLVLDEPRLAQAALELIRSLGHVAHLWDTVEPAPGPGGTARRYRIRFDTDRPVFRRRWDLLRQLRQARRTHPGGRAALGPWGTGRRGAGGGGLGIVSIEPVKPDDPGYGPARCIQVDSPDSTYLVEDMIPTHNTMFAQWVAFQASQIPNALGEKTPVVLFNPKQGQSLKAMADAVGAQTFQLDELTSADGAIDPLRFSRKVEHGLELAVSVLRSVNPWGDRAAAYELPLYRALDYGIKHGATATGQALHVARDGLNDPVITAMVDDVDVLLTSFPKVRALVGVAPQADALRLSQGLTLIEVGDSHLNLPTPGTTDPDVTQRTATTLVRMMVHGTMSAFTGRQGVVLLDEGWVFTSAGRAEMDRLGRLARALEVFPIILTQKITDALDAGLAGGISRGFIMSIPDETEARAAFELFKIEASQDRMDRLTAGPKIAQGQQDQIGNEMDSEAGNAIGNGASAVHAGRPAVATAFNWDSLKALVDSNRVVYRGSVGYYVDLTGRCVPVEVSIPEWFVEVASVNGKDVRARREANRLAAAAGSGD